jgi:hypothetical protein
MPARHGTDGLVHEPRSEVEIDTSLSPKTPVAELWEAWRMAEAGSELALNAWYAASKGQKARTHAAYTAALEREAKAASALARAGVGGAVPAV